MKFFQAIIDFFARLFGGGKKKEEEVTVETVSGDFWEDGADVPADSVVVAVDPTEIETMLAEEGNKDEEDPAVLDTTTSDETGDTGTSSGGSGDTVPIRVPKYMWCLDNGHGKSTPGKRSPIFDDGSQFFEYEFTRDVNARIMKGLDAEGISYQNVVPEVEGDIKLSERCSRANTLETPLPKFYLSIHANANGNGKDWDAASGIETWFHGRSTKGKNLASAFQRHLIKQLGWKDRGIRYHEPPERAFYVLRKTSMPAVLTENGFYTNKAEATKLADPGWRQKVAQAHIDAIVEIENKGIENITTYPKVQKIQKS